MQATKTAHARTIVQAVYRLPELPPETDPRVVELAGRDKVELDAMVAPARGIVADMQRAPAPAASPAHCFPQGLDPDAATTWTAAQANLFIQMSRLEWATVREALDEMHSRSTRDHTRRLVIAAVIGKLDAACFNASLGGGGAA